MAAYTVQLTHPKKVVYATYKLPAPKVGFQFTARFYGPATTLIDGSYDMPGVVRVD